MYVYETELIQAMIWKKPSYSRKQLNRWLHEIDVVADAVADVGGKKLPIKDRVNIWQVQQYDVLDLPEHDLNLIWNLTELYDVAFCLEVFEYIYNPYQAMKNLQMLLKKEGILYVSFLFLYPHHGPKGTDYLRYTRWGIERLLHEAGFSTWQIQPRIFKRVWAAYALYMMEGMKGIYNNLGSIHTEQGYMVKAVK